MATGAIDFPTIHAHLQKHIGDIVAHYERERELARDSGWSGFSGAKGNLSWVRHYVRHMDRAAATWTGGGPAFLERMAALFDEVEPDDDYTWPTDARRQVKAVLERLRDTFSGNGAGVAP
ncbi:MAG: hypothetical protein AB7E47_14005 [Desulfovibrionaceae bacterium]